MGRQVKIYRNCGRRSWRETKVEQGRMMDAGVNPVVVDYDTTYLTFYGDTRQFLL